MDIDYRKLRLTVVVANQLVRGELQAADVYRIENALNSFLHYRTVIIMHTTDCIRLIHSELVQHGSLCTVRYCGAYSIGCSRQTQ